MRFSRIRLENWRNFTSVDVALQNRVFLVGPNASGKSNFLDVFRFLRDIARPGGGLQEAVALRRGISQLRSLSARKHPRIVIDIELAEDDETKWRYQLKFDRGRRPGTSIVVSEQVWRQGVLLFERPDEEDDADPERLTQTRLEQIFANQEFREILEFFRSVNYLHIVPQLVREPERVIPRALDPYGSDILEQIANTPTRTQQSRLNRIQKVLSKAIPQIGELKLERDKAGSPHLFGKYQHWREQGAWQSETEFSDGTLRLIGILWALQLSGGPLLLEEPELSLHPAVVQNIPSMLHKAQQARKEAIRQVMLSTHSKELLLDEGIGPAEVLVLRQTKSKEGTEIVLASDFEDTPGSLSAGYSMGEAVLPYTEPEEIYQMPLVFAE